MAGADHEALWRMAERLGRRARRRKPDGHRRLPPLLFVTDPERTPDPLSVALRLPRGAGVIYRSFGAPEADAVARTLAAIAQGRGLVLLIGADEALAGRCGAHGVHLPERLAHTAPRLRARHPDWLITCAAHDAGALALARRCGLDAALLSPVFASRSPSTRGRSLGPVRFAAMAGQARLPVYALGGVNARTARRLQTSAAAGVAAVDGLAD